jgi:hypothetical protein
MFAAIQQRILVYLVVAFFVCLNGTFAMAQSQCTNSMRLERFSCVFEDCNDTVQVTYPNDDTPRDSHYSCSAVICCKQHFTTCDFDDGECDFVLSDSVKGRLNELAARSRVLVADCHGRYALYPSVNFGRGNNLVLVNEHILR